MFTGYRGGPGLAGKSTETILANARLDSKANDTWLHKNIRSSLQNVFFACSLLKQLDSISLTGLLNHDPTLTSKLYGQV